MKKILFLLLTVVTVCSCYNDDDPGIKSMISTDE